MICDDDHDDDVVNRQMNNRELSIARERCVNSTMMLLRFSIAFIALDKRLVWSFREYHEST